MDHTGQVIIVDTGMDTIMAADIIIRPPITVIPMPAGVIATDTVNQGPVTPPMVQGVWIPQNQTMPD
jgi:hypothetical protein